MQLKCPQCKTYYTINSIMDIDLPAINRTEANLWKAKFFEMYTEVLKANKGIRRLKKTLRAKPYTK